MTRSRLSAGYTAQDGNCHETDALSAASGGKEER